MYACQNAMNTIIYVYIYIYIRVCVFSFMHYTYTVHIITISTCVQLYIDNDYNTMRCEPLLYVHYDCRVANGQRTMAVVVYPSVHFIITYVVHGGQCTTQCTCTLQCTLGIVYAY